MFHRPSAIIPVVLAMLVAAFLARPVAAEPASPAAFGRESIEWCDIWVPRADDHSLPRVLLVGDSITRDYRPGVEKRLAGKASVAQLATSAFVTDPALSMQVILMLNTYSFDVVHLNNGMHGWTHSEEEYAKGLADLVKLVRKYAPRARLVWSQTTPLKDAAAPAATGAPTDSASAEAGRLMSRKDLTSVSDARIRARNTLAARIMAAEGIPVVDLYALSAGHPELYKDSVHFNGGGSGQQADRVVAAILPLLPPARAH